MTISVLVNVIAVLGFVGFQLCLGDILPDYYPDEFRVERLFGIDITLPQSNALNPNISQEKCYGNLCCLAINGSWFTTTRPINTLPESRENLNVRFYFNSRIQNNTNEDIIISADDPATITGSSFNASKPIKFIVHGFLDTGKVQWLRKLAKELLEHGDYNVIRVDWGDGSLTVRYQVVANTRLVGCEIAYLLNYMITNFNLDPRNVHCIGHSYGSHICGYGGKRIKNMGRITGLDPGGTYFTNTPTFIRLSPSDALYVDEIHTDDGVFLTLGFGTTQPMGNVNIFVNNGRDQPGCEISDIILSGLLGNTTIDETGRNILACSHLRVIDIFKETLKQSSCKWVAHECSSYEAFVKGNCSSCGADNSKCVYTGIRADEYVAKSREYAVFYINTAKEEPFCMQHYVVSILLTSPQRSNLGGYLVINITGENGQRIENVKIFEGDESFSPGEIKRELFLSRSDIGKASLIRLKWVFNALSLQCVLGLLCDTSLYIQSVQVSPISRYPESELLASSVVGCSPNGSPTKIENGQTKEFYPRTDCQIIPSK